MGFYLDFEKPLEELDLKIQELRGIAGEGNLELVTEIARLESKAKTLTADIFSKLTRWQRTQLARHQDRPYSLDYIGMIVEEFLELHGDRRFADDPAIVSGIGRIGDVSCVIIGHQKGRGVKERISRNFGQPHPEGYRKAMRLMHLAERFNRPVVTFIDTPGAYPGVGAEERGQAEAIASNLLEMSKLRTPIVSVVIGEGGSGGALALGVSDRLYMLEHSVYSVISPEGCASILWAKNGQTVGQEDFSRAADALKLTAQDLRELGVVTAVIAEPLGGAHRDPRATADSIKDTVVSVLHELMKKDTGTLLQERYGLIRKLGRFVER
jgi:acetyl-CoA carboxylase carboxyl transferase subunit alpha